MALGQSVRSKDHQKNLHQKRKIRSVWPKPSLLNNVSLNFEDSRIKVKEYNLIHHLECKMVHQ